MTMVLLVHVDLSKVHCCHLRGGGGGGGGGGGEEEEEEVEEEEEENRWKREGGGGKRKYGEERIHVWGRKKESRKASGKEGKHEGEEDCLTRSSVKDSNDSFACWTSVGGPSRTILSRSELNST